MKYPETAKRLRKAMDDKGLKQVDLANLSGVSKSNISHYVHGNHVPDSFMAYAMAKVLGVAPEWLMGIDEVPDYVVCGDPELVLLYDRLNVSQKERLKAYARGLLGGEDEEV